MRRAGPVLLSTVVGAFCLLPGCGKSAPSTPPPPANGTPTQPDEQTGPANAPDPQPVPEVPEPLAPPRPVIPTGPVSGRIDGTPFELASASRTGSTVVFAAHDGRSVALALFGSAESLEILGEVPFGSPHVYVRTSRDAPARAYLAGYRLIFDEAEGAIWLELPEGRGTIAGRFTIE